MKDVFRKAIKDRIRVQTSKGLWSAEQLYDLEIPELDSLAVELEKAYNDSKGRSFITQQSTKDNELKLKFELVLAILKDKVADEKAALELRQRRERNQRIADYLAKREDTELFEELDDMSVEEIKEKFVQ